MLTLLLAVAAHAQCAPPACIPHDLANDRAYPQYVRELEELGFANTVPESYQLWDGTVSIKSPTTGATLGTVITRSANDGYLERWVWNDPQSQETTTDGGFLISYQSGANWTAGFDLINNDPLWESYGYAEQDIVYQSPPSQGQINGMMVFESDYLELTSYDLYQPGTVAPVGYLIRERRQVGGEIEWVDHWMFDGWVLIGKGDSLQGSVLVSPSQYTGVKGWMNAKIATNPTHYVRSTYQIGALGDAF